jgi:hypothetical protein
VRGVLVAPIAAIVILSLYVPGARPVMLTDSVELPELLPLIVERVSHDAVLESVQLSVPPPELDTFST